MSDCNNEADENKIEVEISTTTTEIILINENANNNNNSLDLEDNVIVVKAKKRVTFPEDGRIIKDYSDPPKRWIPG